MISFKRIPYAPPISATSVGECRGQLMSLIFQALVPI
jgi:hypothetical protein